MTPGIRYKKGTGLQTRNKEGISAGKLGMQDRRAGRWALGTLPWCRWGLGGQDATCLEQGCSCSPVPAAATSPGCPSTCSMQPGSAAIGSLPSPSFLMQFANGCKDTAKPERDWEPVGCCCRRHRMALPSASRETKAARSQGALVYAVANASCWGWEPRLDTGCVRAGSNTPLSTSTAATPKCWEQITALLAPSGWFVGWQSRSGSVEVPGCP